MDTNDNGIPHDVKNAAKEIFPNCEIKYVDLQRRPLSKIVTRLPSCAKRKGNEVYDLSRKIEDNLHLFENRLNVTAVCASYKVAGAVEKEIPCVTVFVLGKGKIPAKETDIQKIKEDNGHLFDGAEFDVVEGYYRPAYGSCSEMEYASPLRGGVGIGVKGIPGVGTLGGFLEDENGECYILSNDHVLNPPKSSNNTNNDTLNGLVNGAGMFGEFRENESSTNDDSPNEMVQGAGKSVGLGKDENSTSDVETERIRDHIIEQPAETDYNKMLEDAKNDLEGILTKIRKENPQVAELSQAEKDDLEKSDEDSRRYLKRLEHRKLNAKWKVEEIESGRPRQIGVYVGGLKGNMEITCDNHKDKFYVDVAIAKLDKTELNFMTQEKARDTADHCPLYGFEKIKDVVPTGEIVDLQTFVKEICAQDPDLEPEKQLTFLKIGRTTGLTHDGRCDNDNDHLFKKLFVNEVRYPKEKPYTNALYHAPSLYCKNCKPSEGSQTEFNCDENAEMRDMLQEKCATCNKKFEKREMHSFWKHNCFFLRQHPNPFSDYGDSGSLIFDNHGRAWGLLHGIFNSSNIYLTLASPLAVSLKALEERCGEKLKLW